MGVATNFADIHSSQLSIDTADFTDITRGAGWSNPGKPITLIETVHSYGTHLSIENPIDAPEALRRWRAKVCGSDVTFCAWPLAWLTLLTHPTCFPPQTRRLHVYKAHAFVSVRLKKATRCGVTSKNLYKPLGVSKAFQCRCTLSDGRISDL
jgi:hypothetical protein